MPSCFTADCETTFGSSAVRGAEQGPPGQRTAPLVEVAVSQLANRLAALALVHTDRIDEKLLRPNRRFIRPGQEITADGRVEHHTHRLRVLRQISVHVVVEHRVVVDVVDVEPQLIFEPIDGIRVVVFRIRNQLAVCATSAARRIRSCAETADWCRSERRCWSASADYPCSP